VQALEGGLATKAILVQDLGQAYDLLLSVSDQPLEASSVRVS
jgi:hypothetical protein